MRTPLAATLLATIALPAFAQDTAPEAPASLTMPEQVVTDGVPPVPAEVGERLAQYLETRSASVVDVAADGSSILISTRFGEVSQLHELRTPMGARTQLTFFSEPLRGGSYLPGSDDLLYLRDVGGTEDYQLYRYERSTGQEVALTEPGARVSSYGVSSDGRVMAWSTNARNGTDTDIWMSVDGGDAELAVAEGGSWFPSDLSDDGSRMLALKYVSITNSEVWLWERDGDGLTRVSGDDGGAYGDARLAPDGESVYLTSDRDGEYNAVYRVDLDSMEYEALAADLTWNVDSLALSPDGATLAMLVNEDGWGNVYLMDTATGDRRPVEGLPEGVVYGMQFADDAPLLALSFSGPTTTGDVFTVDLETAATTRWTQSEMGGLDPERFVTPELIRTPSFDDLEIPAFVYRPEGEGPHPVVVSIHGGPESQARPYFSAFYQYMLNELGIAVVVPNVRGSSGYGRTWLTLDNGMLREDSVRDIGAILDWIADDPRLDAERVGVYGGSYGGYMVYGSLMHYSDRLVAGCSVVGISNFVTFLENTRDYRRDLRRVEYGDERDAEMREHLISISPTENVDRMQAALMVAQGANDPRVPASEAEQIVEAVRSAGRDVWYFLALDEGHGFRKKENRDAFIATTTYFFEQHLVP